MTIRLIKQKEVAAIEEKQEEPAPSARLVLTARGWIEEFKARKARREQALANSIRNI